MAIIASDTNEIEEIGYNEKEELCELLRSSSYEGKGFTKMQFMILLATTIEDYEKIKANLLANQVGIDSAVNPSYKEIWQHIRKITKKDR